MDNLRRLLRDVLVIADHRYNGSIEITRNNRLWEVSFRERLRDGDGFRVVQGGEGPTLEAALRTTYEAELDKAQRELKRNQELTQALGLKP